MKFFIIFLMIALNLTADENWKPSPVKIYKPGDKEYNQNFADFGKEAREIWEKESKNIKRNIKIEITLSDEQAQIDIAKAELQKLFLKFRQEGKFPENTKIKLPLIKETN